MMPFVLLLSLIAGPTSTGIAGSSLSELSRQTLPARGCAAYLWTNAGRRTLVAMVVGEEARLRIAIDGTPADLARVGAGPTIGMAFGGIATFAGTAGRVTLDLTVERRSDLVGGAVVSAGTLRLEQAGRDVVIVPVAGLVGCAGPTS